MKNRILGQYNGSSPVTRISQDQNQKLSPFFTVGMTLTIFIVMVIIVSLFTPTAQAETVLRFNRWLPPTHNVQGGVMGAWAKKVEEVTNGRVKVSFTASSLGPPPRQFDMVRDGVADLVLGVHAYTPARFRLTQMVEMPFLGDTGEALSVAYWEVHHKYLAKANEHKGVKLLALWVHGPGLIVNSVRPITKTADIQGLKMRVAGGLMTSIASTLGAVPMAAPAPKIYELLARGVADGVLFTAEGVTSFSLQRIVKYVTLIPGGLFNTSFFLAANPKKWNAISEADQNAIMKISSKELSRLAGKSYDDRDKVAAADLRSQGIQVITANPAFVSDLKTKLAGLEQKWIDDAQKKGIDGGAAIQMLRKEAVEFSQ